MVFDDFDGKPSEYKKSVGRGLAPADAPASIDQVRSVRNRKGYFYFRKAIVQPDRRGQ